MTLILVNDKMQQGKLFCNGHIILYSKKKHPERALKSGVSGGDRTHNLWRRRPTLYPIELRIHRIKQ